MRKVLVCVVMSGAMLAMTGMMHTPAVAQPAKKDKDTKTTKSRAGATGYIEINEGKDGKFRFVVRDSDGKFMAMSGPTGYATEKDATKAVEDLKEVIASAKVIKGRKPAKDKPAKDKPAKDK